MDFELRASRVQKEQEKRRAEAKKRRDAEVRAKEEYRKVEEARIEAAAIRAAELELEREKAEIAAAEEQRLTRGINFVEQYHAILLEGAEDDRLLLPPSALEKLNAQDAFGQGPIMFRIENKRNNKISHCGVREFTADENTAALPQKVIDSLLSSPEETIGDIVLKYVALPKVKYAKLQPLLNLFSQVGPIRTVLEENLRHHIALSVGDVVHIWYRGKQHSLRVTEMHPEPYGTLLNADVEVDIDVSVEYAAHSQQEHAAAPSGRTLAGPPVATTAVPLPITSPSSVPALGPFDLPPEPGEDEQGTISCKIKTPSGKGLTRRFRHTDSLLHLFHFVRNEMSDSVSSANELFLSTRMPPRKFGERSVVNDFSSNELTSSRELFMMSVE